jgi:hypothetical protein
VFFLVNLQEIEIREVYIIFCTLLLNVKLTGNDSVGVIRRDKVCVGGKIYIK